MTQPQFVIAHANAWIGLVVACGYFIVAAMALRLRLPDVSVTRYGPPDGVSPALAALLWTGGRYERAFVSALVSLTAKGFIEIRQHGGSFSFRRSQLDGGSLPSEEAAVLSAACPSRGGEYAFSVSDCEHLSVAFHEFRTSLTAEAFPNLVSRHNAIWGAGILFVSLILYVQLEPILRWAQATEGSVPYVDLAVWILIGTASFVAAWRAWSATLKKLVSFLPGTRGRRLPLSATDLLPLFLTAAALAGYWFLASLTSASFALVTFVSVLVILSFRYFLQTPTEAGYKVISQLKGFREFIARADADRLNRENSPGTTPEMIERFTPYAVALNVERGWGEALAQNILELLQFDQVYGLISKRRRENRGERLYPPSPNSLMELRISARKTPD